MQVRVGHSCQLSEGFPHTALPIEFLEVSLQTVCEEHLLCSLVLNYTELGCDCITDGGKGERGG